MITGGQETQKFLSSNPQAAGSNPAGRTKKDKQVMVKEKPLPAFFVLPEGFGPSRQVERQGDPAPDVSYPIIATQ